jgi:hypothetical protein
MLQARRAARGKPFSFETPPQIRAQKHSGTEAAWARVALKGDAQHRCGVNANGASAFLSIPVANSDRRSEDMFMRSIGRLGAALALVLGLMATAPASARVVAVAVAPPPPRAERVVVRPGHAWVGGYWRWTGVRHVWVGGYWAPARAGYRYVPARWAHAGPGWRFHAGYWRRW